MQILRGIKGVEPMINYGILYCEKYENRKKIKNY